MSVAIVASLALAVAPAAADLPGEEPSALPWTDVLPALTDGYDPSSENDCKKGHINCVDKVIREMDRRFEPLAQACSHNALFSLMYMRTTEEYRRSALTPGFFEDPAFVNHQDVVFARLYFEAWDAHYTNKGGLPPLSDSWRIAFEAADAQRVTGLGNMLLGMSAHVNRDLPITLAAIGLVKPDGSSRKTDHDKVNQFLAVVIDPLMQEAAARFDPSVRQSSIDGTHLDEQSSLVMLQSWREQAWRNAERLAEATTPEARAWVEADIERYSALVANLIVAATAYSAADSNAALAAASALGATSAEVSSATLGRIKNVANGVLGGLFVDRRAQRNAHCSKHWAG